MNLDPAAWLQLNAGLGLLIAVATSAIVVNALPVVGRRRIPVLWILSALALAGIVVAAAGLSNMETAAGGDGLEAMADMLTLAGVGAVISLIGVGIGALVAWAMPGRLPKDIECEEPSEDVLVESDEVAEAPRRRRPTWVALVLPAWTFGLAAVAAGAVIGAMSSLA